MLFNFYVEGLGLYVHERRIVNARDGFGRDQVVQVASKLCELSPRRLLLALLLLDHHLSLVLIELLPHLLVLK